MLILFDLDNTLYPTHEQVIKCREAAVKAMIKRGLPGKKDDIIKRLNNIIKEKGSNYQQHFDLLVERLMKKQTEQEKLAIITAGITTYNITKQELIKPYDDAITTLKELKKQGHQLYILTKGKPKKQWDKINRLGLQDYFNKNVWVVSDDGSKKKVIKKLLKKNKKENMILIGDRPDSDIKAATKTGIKSIQLMKGPYKDMKGPEPTRRINNLKDILKVLNH